MANSTTRLKLPLILPGQAQKELFHNEALQRLDILVQAAAAGGPLNSPPDRPDVGATYLVGDEPEGEWRNHSHHISSYTEAGWIYLAPLAGMRIALPDGTIAHFRDGAWSFGELEASTLRLNGRQVLGGALRSIQSPSEGAVIDAEARRTLEQVLALLKEHGLIAA